MAGGLQGKALSLKACGPGFESPVPTLKSRVWLHVSIIPALGRGSEAGRPRNLEAGQSSRTGELGVKQKTPQGNKAEIDRQLAICFVLSEYRYRRTRAHTQGHRTHTHNQIKTQFLKEEDRVASQPKTVSSVLLKHLGWPHDTFDHWM